VGGVVQAVDGFDFGDGEVVVSIEVVEAVGEGGGDGERGAGDG